MNRRFYIFITYAVFLTFSSALYGQHLKNFELVPGTVIRHEPASSGVYVGAPSIVILPDSTYVASLNFTSIQGGDHGTVHKTAVYASYDKGKTWDLLSEIDKQRWSTLFYHRDALYLIGVYEAFGNAVIRKSMDGGRSWSHPDDSKSGLLAEGRYHCAPVPVVINRGRIWRAYEDAPEGREFRAIMISAPVNADLMDANSWTFSNKLEFDREWCEGTMLGWLEGNVVITQDQQVVDFLRCGFSKGKHSTAAMVRISSDGKKATFDPDKDFIHFPGASKKFTIRFDSESRKYWSLVNWIQPGDMKLLEKGKAGMIRNTLALVSSSNLMDWIIERIVLYHPDTRDHAFQYVDWQFDKEDMIAVSRTAFEDGLGGADNYHNANFITFHRIKNFRNNYNLSQ